MPLRAYFIVLVALFVVAAGTAALFVHVQSERDARAVAARDAGFAAQAAAQKLGGDIGLLQATVAQLAANPQIVGTFVKPEGCTLSFGGTGEGDRGHLDIVRADGVVFCSSRTKPATGPLSGYRSEDWLKRANAGPLFLAPALDVATGAQVALASAPIPGGGFVAGFVDLEATGPALASTYGGGRPGVFLVTGGDGPTVIARSLEPRRWVGESIAGTDFARAVDETERPDLDGRERIYASARVPGVDWTIHVGEDSDGAFAAARRLEQRQLGIIGVGLLAVLLAAWFAHRNVVTPIRRLSSTVRETRVGAGVERVSSSGPSEVIALAGHVNDLIDSVSRELRARQASEHNYRLLFENNPNSMWVYDAETLRFLAVNEAAIRKYGFTREEFLAMTIEEIRPPEEVSRLRSLLDASAPEGRGLNLAGLWQHRRKDGTVMDIEITSHELEFEGRPARVVLALDVTERTQLEEQLRQAQRLEAVGQLAGGVAHDFNNLLTVISGYAEAVLQDSDGAFEEELTEITAASRRASILTGQLLAFSRRQVLRPQLVDLNEVVEGITPMLTRLIGEHVEVKAMLAPGLRPVLADPNQLEQVIVNLVVNARDAMPQGGKLTIETAGVELDDDYAAVHPGAQSGPHAMVAVSDTGCGMDAETVSHVFEPFYTTKPVGSGTGLGLSTVHGIVKQSGGNIWVYSEPDHGTTFKVYLPVSDSSAAIEQPGPVDLVAPTGAETVLVVEDDTSLRELTARMLRASGYTVFAASGAEEALRLAEQGGGRIDLLVTDLVMPEIGGRELAERMAEAIPSIAVLFMSGYSDEAVTRQGAIGPGATFLEKPFSAGDLARAAREALDRD